MNVSLRNAAKEPLFQFIVIGLLLIVGERLVNSSNYSGEYQIIVDDQVLAQFMQQQAKTFKPDQALSALTALSGDDRQRLIDDYVRGEVLYREALALDLDRNDSIIRRRLMQKMDYLAQGFYDEVAPLNEEDLKRFKYIKRLFRRYVTTDVLSERLILNHLIVLYNVFGNETTLMLLYKLENKYWSYLKTFLVYLNRMTVDDIPEIPLDLNIARTLRNIDG